MSEASFGPISDDSLATPETLIDSAYTESSDSQGPIPRFAEHINTDINEEDELVDEEKPESTVDENDLKDSEPPTPEEQPSRHKGVMEYDIDDMYPDIGLLVQKKRSELDYHDPDVIRAIWLENRTQIVQQWKEKNSKMHRKDHPKIRPHSNKTTDRRLEFLQKKEDDEQRREELAEEMLAGSKVVPKFDSVQLATNVTTELRYKFNRNNPPIPGFYVKHYVKYKRPPFKLKGTSRSCHTDD